MFYELESNAPEVVREWVQSGAPHRWVEAHQGRWNHHDWLGLLAYLRGEGYGPVPEEAVGRILEAARARWHNLQRWQQAEGPTRWVEARGGAWGHGDWLALLNDLERTGYGPVDPAALGRLVERTRLEWANLRRWRRSGQADAWVEAHATGWGHPEWTALLGALRGSEFWPMDPVRVGRLVEEIRDNAANLRRWRDSGEPACWVESRDGQWGHAEWLLLLQGLQLSEFGPLDPEGVGRVVEEARRHYFNLRRWRESADARQWVEDHGGRSTAEDLRLLVRTLHRTDYWPLEPVSLALAVERVEEEWHNLRRWEATGEPRRWVDDRQGRWEAGDRRALAESLHRSAYWPVSPAAVDGLLERFRQEWWNLRRWRQSGLARRWLEAHRGGRSRHDWLALLETLRRSDFWPMEEAAIRRVVETFRPALNQAA